jgi:hypothetical protein
MSIKTIVNRLEISKLFFLPAMFCLLVPQIMKAHNSVFYALEATLVVITLVMLLFRLFYAPSALQRSEDPGLLYSVLETLDKSSLWFAGKYKPEESYKPYFSTSQFLTENNLSGDIGYGRFSPYIFLAIIIPNLAISWFIYTWKHQLVSVVAILVIMIILLFQMALRRRRAADPTAVVRFTEQALQIREDNIPWKDIYEWRFVAGGKNEKSKYVISYANAATGIADAVVEIGGLNTNRVDFLLLLIFYKAKYGPQ